MKAIIHLELELEIDFDGCKAEPMTRHYPGHDGYIEINSLFYNGVEIAGDLFNKIYRDNEEELIEACIDETKEMEIENALARLEVDR